MRELKIDFRKKVRAWAKSADEPKDCEEAIAVRMIALSIEDYLCPAEAEHKINAEMFIFDTSSDEEEKTFAWYCKKAGINRKSLTGALLDEATAKRLKSALKLAKDLQESCEAGGAKDEHLRKKAERAIILAKKNIGEILKPK